MSNRTLLEFNHDFADLIDFGQIYRFLRSGDQQLLPDGVTFISMRHHSDPDPLTELAQLRERVALLEGQVQKWIRSRRNYRNK